MNGRHAFLERIDLLFDMGFFGRLCGECDVDCRHFLAVGQFAIGHDALDCRQGSEDALPKPISEREELLLALFAFLIVGFLMGFLGDVDGRLNRAYPVSVQDYYL